MRVFMLARACGNDPSEIKPGGTVDMRDPIEVVSVEDGTAILVNRRLKYLQRIITEGIVVRKYQVTISQQVTYSSACVYGNYLFVATSDKIISRILLDGSDYSMKYKPGGVGTIGCISAIGDNVILISEDEWDGRILEYNTETNQVIERVSGIRSPEKVNVIQDGHHTIVKCIQSYKYVVNIYNRDWNQICTINMSADALTVTPGGKLLLVYKNRIHEYSQDGRLIRKLLYKYKLKNIRAITWSGRCLWVLERDPHSIKIFISN